MLPIASSPAAIFPVHLLTFGRFTPFPATAGSEAYQTKEFLRSHAAESLPHILFCLNNDRISSKAAGWSCSRPCFRLG
ncbi:MAG: hypothetical protein D6820_18750 [Lentisphaerae bacterium]|nr:MAG: hypothetical protein D6820_18750 [Lentisphaerota bacterium]